MRCRNLPEYFDRLNPNNHDNGLKISGSRFVSNRRVIIGQQISRSFESIIAIMKASYEHSDES